MKILNTFLIIIIVNLSLALRIDFISDRTIQMNLVEINKKDIDLSAFNLELKSKQMKNTRIFKIL